MSNLYMFRRANCIAEERLSSRRWTWCVGKGFVRSNV